MESSHGDFKTKSNGIHYTPRALALHVASEIAKVYAFDGAPIRILDPAVGGGELLSTMVATFSGNVLGLQAIGYDTDASALAVAQKRLIEEFPELNFQLHHSDFLDMVEGPSQSSLFSDGRAVVVPFDIVIANPPYVRTQNLSPGRVRELAQKFNLDGRIDVYQAFLRGISTVLRPGGIAGVIVSNRFMSIRSGDATRSAIMRDFDILHIWDLGDTRLFEAAILPAVLVLRKKEEAARARIRPKFTTAYRAVDSLIERLPSVKNACEALQTSGLVRLEDGSVLNIQHGFLGSTSANGTWCMSTRTSDAWLRQVNLNSKRKFGDVGKIRVGVKTTADSVFIPRSWNLDDQDCPELLRPLTTHHVARRFRSLPVERQILYPHVVEDGIRAAANLDRFPLTKRYLESHRDALEKRKYVIEGGRQWYEIWVPQDPEAWMKPKIVFRDIAEQPTFWMDLEGTVVNGDCYWITSENGNIDDLWLILAVANSRFIEKFYDHSFNNKLYAGRRRFMTQYVERFPLPSIDSPRSARMIELAKRIHSEPKLCSVSNDFNELERLVSESFGVESNPVENERNSLEVESGFFDSRSSLQIA